ncbi:MAG TPA: TetR/AcrR family transcriptional regulator [Actinophytocola sp.]|uniref:TetR/AcrR family transcriptional regulator n=1 Tax=Actinophytocola sp. TaxID=1872138 RepID=UPI002F934B74
MTETKSRRRGAELEQAILDAAWAELNDVGYAALTIEAVAARAGTSKPVIYRRWPGRAELVLAAWARQRPKPVPATDMGSLRADLIALFNRIARRAEGMMSEVVAGVMGEAFRHPEVAEILRERLRTAPLGDWVNGIVERAVERGELPPVTVPPRAARMPIDLIRNETMMSGGPITETDIAEFVDDVYLPLLRGLAASPG